MPLSSLPKDFFFFRSVKIGCINFAGNKINVTQEKIFILERVESIGIAAQNAGHQYFSFNIHCFQRPSF